MTDLHIEIESADKDLKQLITNNVTCINSMRDYRSTPESFRIEFDFEPASMLDYLALTGDASDNVPGVMGIGKVGAQKLIAQYHTLENMYEHIDEITGATQRKLIEGKEAAFHSKMLIQLMYIPDMEQKSLEEYKLHVDFDRFRTILIDQR
jgi:DNA polymerase-1